MSAEKLSLFTVNIQGLGKLHVLANTTWHAIDVAYTQLCDHESDHKKYTARKTKI